MGLQPGNVIDTVCLNLTQRNSVTPYSNISIRYYYTAGNFTFPVSLTAWAPGLSGLGSYIFSAMVDLSTIPATGGPVKFPVTNFTWNGSVSDLVLEFCWESSVAMPSDPTAGTLLSGRKTARVRAPVVAATGACILSPTAANVARNTSLYRPDVCFIVKLSTGLPMQPGLTAVAAWPNPATDHFFIPLVGAWRMRPCASKTGIMSPGFRQVALIPACIGGACRLRMDNS
jgi:hypothetical protein